MKKILIRSAAWIAVAAGPALAGDLEPVVRPGIFGAPPAFEPVVAPGVLGAPPAFSTYPRMHYIWTGAYVGINAGASFGHVNWSSDPDAASGGNSAVSGLIGATIGYNMQTNDPWVFGAEADVNASGLKTTVPLASCGSSCAVTNPWFTTARVRVGYAFETILPYVTAGVAFGDLVATPTFAAFSRQYADNFGWTAGLGVEVVIWAPLRAKLEYLHVDLGSIQCPLTAGTPPCLGPRFNVSTDIIRAGLNYRIWSN